jgi:hypothetical protein
MNMDTVTGTLTAWERTWTRENVDLAQVLNPLMLVDSKSCI